MALDVSQSLISLLKALAPRNIPTYMMNKADECHGRKRKKLYLSLQCAHDGVANDEHHQLTKLVALDVFHLLISLLKALALSNIPYYVMIEATK
jgi:hypothetical protein